MRRLILIALLCTACRTTAPPDLILVNGKVFTAGDANPWAQAIAIRGDRFSAVGTNGEVRALAGRRTRVIDVEGRTVVPGINDAHVHVPFGPDIEPVALPPNASVDEIFTGLKEAVKKAKPGKWIGATFGARVIDDPRLRRDVLDVIAPDNPLGLTSDAGHAAVFNTLGLQRLGLAPDSNRGPRPEARGLPDGWVYEDELWLKLREETESAPDLCGRMKRFAGEAVRYGITSIQTMPSLSAETERELARRCTDLPIRVRWIELNIGAVNEHPLMPQKYILDGTPVERGAAIRASYADRPGEHGWLDYTDADIRRILEVAARGQQPLLLHIAGNVALGKVFLEMRRLGVNWPPLRVRIEHGDFIDELADEAQRTGVIIVQNPAHFTILELLRDRYGDAMPRRFMPMRSLLERGIPVAIGSDGPLNPWLNVMFAIWHRIPWEAITRAQAVIAYTRGSAYAEFAEKEKGTITPGKLADFAVLSRDPFSVSPDQLPMTRSVMTVVGGRVVWEDGALAHPH